VNDTKKFIPIEYHEDGMIFPLRDGDKIIKPALTGLRCIMMSYFIVVIKDEKKL